MHYSIHTHSDSLHVYIQSITLSMFRMQYNKCIQDAYLNYIVSPAFVPPWAMGIKVKFYSILGFRLTPQFYGDHSSITSAKRWVGGVRKWQFLLIYSTIHADVGGCVGQKNPKTSWHNTWKVPNGSIF